MAFVVLLDPQPQVVVSALEDASDPVYEAMVDRVYEVVDRLEQDPASRQHTTQFQTEGVEFCHVTRFAPGTDWVAVWRFAAEDARTVVVMHLGPPGWPGLPPLPPLTTP